MSDAPERIWLDTFSSDENWTANSEAARSHEVEYVRADRIEELEADLRKMALDVIAADGQAAEAYQAQLLAEAKLANAIEDAANYEDCLNSWFDTKKLAEDQIDPKIVAAASGYLRTSRNGGMPDTESDMVLSVIQDMAFRGVFSSIFTQFTLAELKGEK